MTGIIKVEIIGEEKGVEHYNEITIFKYVSWSMLLYLYTCSLKLANSWFSTLEARLAGRIFSGQEQSIFKLFSEGSQEIKKEEEGIILPIN